MRVSFVYHNLVYINILSYPSRYLLFIKISIYNLIILAFAGLRQNLENITSEERSTIGVNDDDIFFSFISDFQFQQTKQSILLGKNSLNYF